jgi:hypothetical protein
MAGMADIGATELVRLTKLRWRIERDYLDLKQECGLGHYEGRGWRGFHHHVSLAIAAYGYLISQAGAIPPSAPENPIPRQKPSLPEGHAPRGSAAASSPPRAKLHRHREGQADTRHHQTTTAMSLLSKTGHTSTTFMTQ